MLEKATKDHVRPWDSFKDWCKKHLDGEGLAEYQLSVLKQTSSVGECKGDLHKIVTNADLPSEEAVARCITGLQPDVQALSQALSLAVAECFNRHDTLLELFQSAAVAVEADPEPVQTSVVVAQPACCGKSNRRKARKQRQAAACKRKGSFASAKARPQSKVDKPKAKACKRKCFKCGKSGHIAKHCTQACCDQAVENEC